MEQSKINRINELARKAKVEPLSQKEAEEQAALRQEYLREFRASFAGILDNTVVKYPDGSVKRLKDSKK